MVHVQPRECPPRSADHVKWQAGFYGETRFTQRFGNIIAQHLANLLGRFAVQYVMPQCAQRQGHARAQFSVGYANKLKAATTKIADIAIGMWVIA